MSARPLVIRVGRRDLDHTLDWPPVHLVHQLAFRVKRMHLGEVMRGPNGVVVDVIRYRDKMQQDRRVYRLTRQGVFVGEYKTPEELGKVVDLAELVEDDPGQPATPPHGCREASHGRLLRSRSRYAHVASCRFAQLTAPSVVTTCRTT
jgi:hypothetical protein